MQINGPEQIEKTMTGNFLHQFLDAKGILEAKEKFTASSKTSKATSLSAEARQLLALQVVEASRALKQNNEKEGGETTKTGNEKNSSTPDDSKGNQSKDVDSRMLAMLNSKGKDVGIQGEQTKQGGTTAQNQSTTPSQPGSNKTDAAKKSAKEESMLRNLPGASHPSQVRNQNPADALKKNTSNAYFKNSSSKR
jgi:hypothetical protein